MKRLAAIFFLFMSAGWVLPAPASAQQAAGDELASAPRIDLPAFKKLLDAGNVLVLDVRDADSYKAGHIPGAISMPLDEVARHTAELKAEKRPIVTYCA